MSLSIYNSTIKPLDSGDTFLGQYYDNIIDFSQINISIKCDTGYQLTWLFSQDKININYSIIENIPYSATTQFFQKSALQRYFKLSITATAGNMTNLEVQTIYKNNNIII